MYSNRCSSANNTVLKDWLEVAPFRIPRLPVGPRPLCIVDITMPRRGQVLALPGLSDDRQP